MNIKQLDRDLMALADKKNCLQRLAYQDERYDRIEDELHQLEDAFLEAYESYLSLAFRQVHQTLRTEAEVLSPIAYLARAYVQRSEVRNGNYTYDVADGAGVLVDVGGMPTHDARLVLVPNPTRIVLLAPGRGRWVIWQVPADA